MKTRYREPRKNNKGIPWACDCGVTILVTTSHDPNTRGEKYLSCPYEISDKLESNKQSFVWFYKGPSQGCGFKRWWISACQYEFVKIRDKKNEMKQELDVVKKRIHDHEVMIFELELQVEELMEEKKKQQESNGGEQFDTVIAVVNLMEKFDEMEKKYEALERKYQSLNKYL